MRCSAAAWRAASLEPLTLHEARHMFASLMIGAGVNAKALSTYMGHATIGITFDRLRALDGRQRGRGASLLDGCLERAMAETARCAEVA